MFVKTVTFGKKIRTVEDDANYVAQRRREKEDGTKSRGSLNLSLSFRRGTACGVTKELRRIYMQEVRANSVQSKAFVNDTPPTRKATGNNRELGWRRIPRGTGR